MPVYANIDSKLSQCEDWFGGTTTYTVVSELDDPTWPCIECLPKVVSDFVGEQSRFHIMPISAKWKHKSSIHIGFIVFNGGVTTFFAKSVFTYIHSTSKVRSQCFQRSPVELNYGIDNWKDIRHKLQFGSNIFRRIFVLKEFFKRNLTYEYSTGSLIILEPHIAICIWFRCTAGVSWNMFRSIPPKWTRERTIHKAHTTQNWCTPVVITRSRSNSLLIHILLPVVGGVVSK